MAFIRADLPIQGDKNVMWDYTPVRNRVDIQICDILGYSLRNVF